MKTEKNIVQNLSNEEKEIFKRHLYSRENISFHLIALFLVCLDLLFIFWVQGFKSIYLNEAQIKQIRDKYINTFYLESEALDRALQLEKAEQRSDLKLREDKRKETPDIKDNADTEARKSPHYGKMKMVILNIATDYDDLIARIPSANISGIIKDDLDAMLDKVIKKINEDMTKPQFDPALDMNYFETEKLNLKREEIKPTINMNRIETGLLEVQANRSQNAVNKQIRLNEPQLNYCIHKHTRFTINTKLTITVIFKINNLGYVNRNTIKIIGTNIKDDKLIKCIKRVIATWKNFGEIDDKENTYLVRQKWIF